MKHLRRTVLAALAAALCIAQVAIAHDRHHGRSGAVITPSEGRLVGEGWAQIYSLRRQWYTLLDQMWVR